MNDMYKDLEEYIVKTLKTTRKPVDPFEEPDDVFLGTESKELHLVNIDKYKERTTRNNEILSSLEEHRDTITINNSVNIDDVKYLDKLGCDILCEGVIIEQFSKDYSSTGYTIVKKAVSNRIKYLIDENNKIDKEINEDLQLVRSNLLTNYNNFISDITSLKEFINGFPKALKDEIESDDFCVYPWYVDVDGVTVYNSIMSMCISYFYKPSCLRNKLLDIYTDTFSNLSGYIEIDESKMLENIFSIKSSKFTVGILYILIKNFNVGDNKELSFVIDSAKNSKINTTKYLSTLTILSELSNSLREFSESADYFKRILTILKLISIDTINKK